MTATSLISGIGAEDLLDLGRVDVLAAADDHVALAVDEVVVAVSIAARDVADGAVVAAEGFRRLLGQLPVALKRVRRPCVDLAGLAGGDLAAVVAEELDPAGAGELAPDRAEPGQLLFRTQEGTQPVSVDP